MASSALAVPRHFLTSIIMTCVNDNGSVTLIREGAPSVRMFVKKYRPSVPDAEDLTYVLCIVVGNAEAVPMGTGTKQEMEAKLKSMTREIATQISRNPKGNLLSGAGTASAINASKKAFNKAANIKIRASWVLAALVIVAFSYIGYVKFEEHVSNKGSISQSYKQEVAAPAAPVQSIQSSPVNESPAPQQESMTTAPKVEVQIAPPTVTSAKQSGGHVGQPQVSGSLSALGLGGN